jgi:hypothetical protein
MIGSDWHASSCMGDLVFPRSTSRKPSWIVVAAMSCVAASSLAPSASAGNATLGSDTADGAQSLSVFEAKTPPLRVTPMRTSGTYPQVSGRGVDLTAVNFALRQAVVDDQQSFGKLVPKVDPRTAPGVYQTSPKRRLISASTTVVSALVPTLTLLPAGNDGSWWFSATIEVATARRVAISDLFVDSSQGLKVLAAAARQRLTRENACVRRSVETAGTHFASGFSPTSKHYQYFALLPDGLTIGFPLGQVSGPVCSRVRVTVPYSALRPYLNRLGRELVEGVRRPSAFLHWRQ